MLVHQSVLGLLTIFCSLHCAAGSCEEVDGKCICTSTAGVEWDVTSIQSNNIQTTGDTMPGCTLCTGDWTYNFAICGNALQQIGTGCLSTQTRNAYRVDESVSQRCEYMGQDATTGDPLTVTDLTDVDGISIAYTDTVRTMTVNLRCETPYALAPEPLPQGSGSNNIVLTWYTDAVCLASGGNGWLIVILMSVAAGIYVGGGIGYVKRQSPDAPIALDSHPHIEYWRQVPGLVSDGIYFSRVKLSSSAGFLAFLAPTDQLGTGSSYTEIDEGGAGGSDEKKLLKPEGQRGGPTPRPKAKPNPKVAAAASSDEESSGSDDSSDDEGKKDPVE